MSGSLSMEESLILGLAMVGWIACLVSVARSIVKEDREILAESNRRVTMVRMQAEADRKRSEALKREHERIMRIG